MRREGIVTIFIEIKKSPEMLYSIVRGAFVRKFVDCDTNFGVLPNRSIRYDIALLDVFFFDVCVEKPHP